MDSLLAEIKLLGVILIVVCIVYLTAMSSGDSEVQYYPATPELYRRATILSPEDQPGTPPLRLRLTDEVASVEADE
jgi:hypothetical protein